MPLAFCAEHVAMCTFAFARWQIPPDFVGKTRAFANFLLSLICTSSFESKSLASTVWQIRSLPIHRRTLSGHQMTFISRTLSGHHTSFV
eukprot:2712273-Amphidinium_carterae.1